MNLMNLPLALRRGLAFLALASLGCAGFCSPGTAESPAPSTPAAVSPASPPLDDVRLDRAVTLDEVGTPLEEVLEGLSDENLTLACGRYCKQQKVQIRLKRRQLRALMGALAELLPGR